MTDDFEARWRAVAAADPMHATYPEAVPGYRAEVTAGRLQGLVWPGRRLPSIPESCYPDDAIELPDEPDHGEAIMPHAGSAMTVVWRRPATLATDDAVQALVDAIAKADEPRPWWARIVRWRR